MHLLYELNKQCTVGEGLLFKAHLNSRTQPANPYMGSNILEIKQG